MPNNMRSGSGDAVCGSFFPDFLVPVFAAPVWPVWSLVAALSVLEGVVAALLLGFVVLGCCVVVELCEFWSVVVDCATAIPVQSSATAAK